MRNAGEGEEVHVIRARINQVGGSNTQLTSGDTIKIKWYLLYQYLIASSYVRIWTKRIGRVRTSNSKKQRPWRWCSLLTTSPYRSGRICFEYFTHPTNTPPHAQWKVKLDMSFTTGWELGPPISAARLGRFIFERDTWQNLWLGLWRGFSSR